MPGFFNIDKAVKYVKVIADNNRCSTCDKLLGLRLRYPCGHIACKECIETTDECLTCFNSLQNSNAVIDSFQSQHIQNVFNLLTVFQETFNIDVNKRYRLSEKLKEEERFFPKCIQASITYSNKRRSSQCLTQKDKENLSPLVIAGEKINSSQSLKMNTRKNLVQKWLESNENVQSPVRKPFTAINVNSAFVPSKENSGLNKSKQHNGRYGRKRGFNKNKNIVSVKQKKSLIKLNEPFLRQYNDVKAIKEKDPDSQLKSNKILNGQDIFQLVNYQKHEKCPNENLDTIVIDDTPTQEFDKDKKAWLAVLETEKNMRNYDKKTHIHDDYNIPMAQAQTIMPADVLNKRKNVSFYKKAPLYQSCWLCLNSCKNENTENQRFHSKDVFITVNTSSIIASIKITNDKYNTNIKNSISTQTVEDIQDTNKNMHITSPINDKQIDIISQDLFVKDIDLFEENPKENLRNNEKACELPCQETNHSDSDSDIYCSGTFEVIAEVHTPSERDYGVLSAINNDYQRVRQSGRRRTIDSNNSSEKENVEPNKMKKPRKGKKQDMKK